MVGGLQAELHGNTNLTYSLISAVEEVLEMLGIAILIYALLIYIAEALGSPTIVFKPRSRSQYLDQDQDDVKDLDDRTRGKIRRNLAS